MPNIIKKTKIQRGGSGRSGHSHKSLDDNNLQMRLLQLQLPDPVVEEIVKYKFPSYEFLNLNKEYLLQDELFNSTARTIYSILDEMDKINKTEKNSPKDVPTLKGLIKLLDDSVVLLLMKIICTTANDKVCKDINKYTEKEMDRLRPSLSSPISWIEGFIQTHRICEQQLQNIESIVIDKLHRRHEKSQKSNKK